MRLLNIHSFKFQEFGDYDLPPYIITSHRWVNDETTYAKVLQGLDTSSAGFRKIRGFCDVARRTKQADWIWTDTCCINKDSSAELTESINSMFNWYSKADVCYAYLADVRPLSAGNQAVLEDLQKSEWFQRGWTLQELLAPRCVIFYTRDWERLGHKCCSGFGVRSCPGCAQSSSTTLNSMLAQITKLPEEILWDYDVSKSIRPRQKWSWAEGRRTTKPEDQAYCLLGIFGIYMPLIYGEGRINAKRRLQQEITRRYPGLNQRPPPSQKPPKPLVDERDSSGWSENWDPFLQAPLFEEPKMARCRRAQPQAPSNKSKVLFFDFGTQPPSPPKSSGPKSSASKGSPPSPLTQAKDCSKNSPSHAHAKEHSKKAPPRPQAKDCPQTSPSQTHAKDLPKTARAPAQAKTTPKNPPPQAQFRDSPATLAQLQAARQHLQHMYKNPLAMVSPAQIAAAGAYLPKLNKPEKLALLTPAQIAAAGEFLPVWKVEEIASLTPAQIAQRKARDKNRTVF